MFSLHSLATQKRDARIHGLEFCEQPVKSRELAENHNLAAGMMQDEEAKLTSVGTNGQDLRSRKGSPLENPDEFNLPV